MKNLNESKKCEKFESIIFFILFYFNFFFKGKNFIFLKIFLIFTDGQTAIVERIPIEIEYFAGVEKCRKRLVGQPSAFLQFQNGDPAQSVQRHRYSFRIPFFFNQKLKKKKKKLINLKGIKIFKHLSKQEKKRICFYFWIIKFYFGRLLLLFF